MKGKILFFLFICFFLFYLYISHLNQENVKFFVGGKTFEMSVADYVVASFALGIVVSMIIGFLFDIRSAISGWQRGKREKKRDEFKELLEKAKSYDLRGDRDKAIDQINRVILKAPDMEEAYFLLADFYVSMKQYDKAVETLDIAETSLGKKESILLRKAKTHQITKDLAKTESELKDVAKLNAANIEALTMLRDVYITQKNWDDAYETEKKVRKFIKTEEENWRLHGLRYEKACALYKKGNRSDFDYLIKELKDIINEDKTFIPAYILLADIYKDTGKPNEAGRVYGRGYNKTGHIIFLSKMEDLYIDRGDPGVILKIYRRILDVAPRNSLVEFLYARLCLRLEMIDEAIDTLNTLAAEGIEFRGIHKAMAEAYIHRGQTDKALEEFRIAFPAEHVYIPFRCDNCRAKKEQWEDFCDSCNSWGTINVRKEDFLRGDAPELKALYESEDWVEGV